MKNNMKNEFSPENNIKSIEKELVGVVKGRTDYFFVGDIKIESPNHPSIVCDPQECVATHPLLVVDYARMIGAIYTDPVKGELIVMEMTGGEFQPHTLTIFELMDLFG
jgi:hypothetical protein